MCSNMNHQVLRLRESLVTVSTGVMFLGHVSFYMFPQVSYHGKSLSTLRAGEGLLSCMDTTVFVQGARLGKGLVTGGAGEG